MQFFMRGFVKATTIRGVLQRNPRILAEAKVVAMDMEHIEECMLTRRRLGGCQTDHRGAFRRHGRL